MHTQTPLDIARNIRQGLDRLVQEALDATGLSRSTLREAEALLAAAPSIDRTVPFSSVATWLGSRSVQGQLLLILIQARHFSRFTAQYLAQPLAPDARPAFQSARSQTRNLLRFVQAARKRLRLHIEMLRDLRAARADLARTGTTVLPRTTLAFILGDRWHAIAGMAICDRVTLERVDEVFSGALVHLTGQPN
jgi:hypothetical protein